VTTRLPARGPKHAKDLSKPQVNLGVPQNATLQKCELHWVKAESKGYGNTGNKGCGSVRCVLLGQDFSRADLLFVRLRNARYSVCVTLTIQREADSIWK